MTGQPDIFNVAFDNVNALTPKRRRVLAAYGEVLLPVLDSLDVTAAVRIDDYTGFGNTVNPKVSALFTPVEWLRFRASYNSGFRVPAFNQIFNGTTQSPNPGNNLVDPTTCASGVVNPAVPGCAAITPDTLTGGNLELGPETSDQYSAGIVFEPSRHFSASLDFWSIAVDNVIGTLTTQQLLANAAFFPERLVRTNGIITLLDLRSANIGSRRTQGLELALRGNLDAWGGTLSMALDGTYLLQKKEKLLPAGAYQDIIGRFTFAGDLGLRWKHNASVTWSNEVLTVSLSQLFRSGYTNQQLPGIANGTVTRPDVERRVDDYILYNLSVGYRVTDNYTMTLGVRNLFDTDPPFAITYDSNTGAGSSWEPRVADPRGRSFTVSARVTF